MSERERIEREATRIVYELPLDRDPVKSIVDLAMRERAAAFEEAAKACEVLRRFEPRMDGSLISRDPSGNAALNRAAVDIRALAAQERAQ